MRRIPDITSRLRVSDDAEHRLGGAVPSPAVAFLLAIITLPSLFWLVTLKRTTVYTGPEEWLMANVVPAMQRWVEGNLPFLHGVLLGISGLGAGWFVALAFAGLGLLALAKQRRDLALLLALGTLAFPIEWALKYFTSTDSISLGQLFTALFDVNGIGLDDIADFPAGHALRATVLYGLAAFCVARLAHDRRQGLIAYAVAIGLILAISATRIYLGAHYPMDVLGGWMAGAALVSILIAVHVLQVDSRESELAGPAQAAPARRRVAVPRRAPPAAARAISATAASDPPGSEG